MSNAGIEKIHISSNDSPITIEAIRQLFNEFEGRRQTETDKLIEGMGVQNIQSLFATINQEKN